MLRGVVLRRGHLRLKISPSRGLGGTRDGRESVRRPRAITRDGALSPGFATGAAATLAALAFAVRRPRVLGQTSYSPSLGAACSSDAQCQQGYYKTVVCADNGIVGDGPLNCCVSEGRCEVDSDCCDTMLCVPGHEARYCAYLGFPTQGLGAPCTSANLSL